MVETEPRKLELLQPLATFEKRKSLLDIVTFSPDIKILQSIDYPVGSYCLLERDGQTAVDAAAGAGRQRRSGTDEVRYADGHQLPERRADADGA